MEKQKETNVTNEMMRRIIMCLCGVIVAGISCGLFSLSALGMDPFQVLAHGIWRHTPLSYGSCYTVISIVMIIVVIVINRKKIGLGTLINIFLYGYVVDFSEMVFSRLIPVQTFPVRLAELAAALVIMCFASALYFTADLGVSVYDAMALTADEHLKTPFYVLRIISDMFCVIVGAILCYTSDFSLAGNSALFVTAGIGTILTAFFMGPFIEFFNHKVAEPLRYGKSLQH